MAGSGIRDIGSDFKGTGASSSVANAFRSRFRVEAPGPIDTPSGPLFAFEIRTSAPPVPLSPAPNPSPSCFTPCCSLSAAACPEVSGGSRDRELLLDSWRFMPHLPPCSSLRGRLGGAPGRLREHREGQKSSTHQTLTH